MLILSYNLSQQVLLSGASFHAHRRLSQKQTPPLRPPLRGIFIEILMNDIRDSLTPRITSTLQNFRHSKGRFSGRRICIYT